MALSVYTDYRLFELEQSIFPGKALFFNQVRLMFFLFLQENILLVLIRSASARHF